MIMINNEQSFEHRNQELEIVQFQIQATKFKPFLLLGVIGMD